MICDQGPHYLEEASPAWGVLPKLLQTKAHTRQDAQIEIRQVKEKLGTPICWRRPLQEGSNEPQGPSQRDDSLSSTITAAPVWHTE